MSHHTPGPWRLAAEVDALNDDCNGRHLVYIPVKDVDGGMVSAITVYGRDRNGRPARGERKAVVGPNRANVVSSEEETRANARLIAAAPEMIEVLSEAFRVVQLFHRHEALSSDGEQLAVKLMNKLCDVNHKATLPPELVA